MDIIIWDRRIEGRFPESKELKQRIRDLIAPEKPLGHSDARRN
jgi:selenoprotein W-related protein